MALGIILKKMTTIFREARSGFSFAPSLLLKSTDQKSAGILYYAI